MANHYNQGRIDGNAEQNYGATPARALTLKAKAAQANRRFNMSAVCLCLFVPWLLFCIMYAVMSFSLHYESKPLTYLCVLLGFVFVAITAKLAYEAATKEDSDARWFIFLAVTCFIAWAMGVVLGDVNYFYNLEPYYEVSQLNTYPNVDPANTPGQQVMDAGRVTFTKGSGLDLTKPMWFRNMDTYCVVPIVNPGPEANGQATTTKAPDKARQQPENYDFWAVGLNCCSSGKNKQAGGMVEFTCGEWSNPRASSGLRVMREDQRAFYRLAVQQAEATYGIRANHPMFFFWLQDPQNEFDHDLHEGFKYYLFGVFSFFALMLSLVILAVVLFSSYVS